MQTPGSLLTEACSASSLPFLLPLKSLAAARWGAGAGGPGPWHWAPRTTLGLPATGFRGTETSQLYLTHYYFEVSAAGATPQTTGYDLQPLSTADSVPMFGGSRPGMWAAESAPESHPRGRSTGTRSTSRTGDADSFLEAAAAQRASREGRERCGQGRGSQEHHLPGTGSTERPGGSGWAGPQGSQGESRKVCEGLKLEETSGGLLRVLTGRGMDVGPPEKPTTNPRLDGAPSLSP